MGDGGQGNRERTHLGCQSPRSQVIVATIRHPHGVLPGAGTDFDRTDYSGPKSHLSPTESPEEGCGDRDP